MGSTKKNITNKGSLEPKEIESTRGKDGWNGTDPIGANNALKKLDAELPAIRFTESITPFPNIDQVKSPSTNLIDESTQQLRELMRSITEKTIDEQNLFSSVNTVNAACNCVKNITALLRLKLDIYKSYKK